MATAPMSDLTQSLPHDALAAVLRRLQPTPRLLAASRCVCKTWRAVVDAHGLLRADLLPLSVSGIFTHSGDETFTDYFALPRPSTTEIAAATFDLDSDDQADGPLMVVQHCNGLLLLGDSSSPTVLNPATGERARLPSPPPDDFYGEPDYDYEDGFLVFDPTVSPHYQVLLINSIPFIPWPDSQVVRPSTMAREWPPSSYTTRVFSSETRQWEMKPFTRQGDARGTIRDVLWCPDFHYCYAAYWHGALYVHQRDFVMRMNLWDCTYQLIKMPKGEEFWDNWYLGKSSGGVHCALFKGFGGFGLQVWFLDETTCGGQMKWELRRDVDLRPLLMNFPSDDCGDGPSMVQCANLDEDEIRRSLSILGFHPSEQIVFIHTPSKRVMAYRFSSSEAQDLGYLPMDEVPRHRIHCSFPYTPCRMGELSSKL